MSRGSGIDVVHQLVEEGGDEADRADRLWIRHACGTQNADHADRAAGLAVRGEDQRHVTHLLGRVLGADEDLDGARATAPDAVEQLAEIGAVLERGEDAPELGAPLELGASMTRRSPSLT